MALLDQLLTDLDRLADEADLATNTVAAYRRDLRAWAAHLEDVGVDDLATVDATVVASFAEALRTGELSGRGVAPATVQRRLAAVRRVHRARVAWGDAEVDPTADLQLPQASREGDDGADGGDAVPDPEALDDLVAAVGAEPGAADDAVRDRALLAVLVDAGPRISELVALDLADLRHDGRSLCVAGRTLPLGTVARRAVERWVVDVRPRLVRDGETALLTNLRGRRLSRQGAWMVVRRRAEAAGLAVGPRGLRAAYVARLVAEGHDDAEVRRRTGDRTDHAQRRHRR